MIGEAPGNEEHDLSLSGSKVAHRFAGERSDTETVDGSGSSSESAYSTASPNVITCPSANGASHAASSSRERAAGDAVATLRCSREYGPAHLAGRRQGKRYLRPGTTPLA